MRAGRQCGEGARMPDRHTVKDHNHALGGAGGPHGVNGGLAAVGGGIVYVPAQELHQPAGSGWNHSIYRRDKPFHQE
jgi:hypothetical protein